METHRATDTTRADISDLSVVMYRKTLSDIPEHPLPVGFAIRRYIAGDEERWLSIHEIADRNNTFNAGTFRRQFGTDSRLLESRQFYLIAPDGRAIGTTTAWFKASLGRVHWVALLPAYQGRGLAKPLLSIACKRLGVLGHNETYLATSTARFPALCLYATFGFRPGLPPSMRSNGELHRSPEEKEAWDTIWPAVRERISERSTQRR